MIQPRFASAIEIAYAKAGDVDLTTDSVRKLGRAIAETILEYDDFSAGA